MIRFCSAGSSVISFFATTGAVCRIATVFTGLIPDEGLADAITIAGLTASKVVAAGSTGVFACKLAILVLSITVQPTLTVPALIILSSVAAWCDRSITLLLVKGLRSLMTTTHERPLR